MLRAQTIVTAPGTCLALIPIITVFADASCDTQAKSLGRLPYKTLGLDDIRDGSGERLWYAVSVNFKDDPRGAVPLNSDAPGTIAVLDSEGNVINNGQDMTGAIAVILAPEPH